MRGCSPGAWRRRRRLSCCRAIGVYGEPNPWQVQARAISTLIDFLNVTKYPPSLLFLLMTLGPAAILCASADRVPDAVKQPLIVFGRAPFAFYVAHLYLLHTLAVAFGVMQGFDARAFLTYSFFFPKGYGVGLPGVYAVWLLVVAMLYPLCRWVAAAKRRRQRLVAQLSVGSELVLATPPASEPNGRRTSGVSVWRNYPCDQLMRLPQLCSQLSPAALLSFMRRNRRRSANRINSSEPGS